MKAEGYIEKWITYGNDYVAAKELTVLPGMEELASLLEIVYLYDSGQYIKHQRGPRKLAHLALAGRHGLGR